MDPLFLCLFDLPIVGRHLLPRPAVEDRHLFRAQPPRSHGRVDRHVAAADHRHAAPDLRRCPRVPAELAQAQLA